MPDASPTHIVKLIQKLRYVAKDTLLLSIYKFVVPTFNSDNKNSAIFDLFKNDNYKEFKIQRTHIPMDRLIYCYVEKYDTNFISLLQSGT